MRIAALARFAPAAAQALMALALVVAAFAWPASAEDQTSKGRRVALVIGNAGYQNLAPLRTTRNDADLVSRALRDIGFNVYLHNDASLSRFQKALMEFEHTAQGADIALIYYAGHGLSFEGTSYLVPVDAKVERGIDVINGAIAIDRLVSTLEGSATRGIVIIDASRDNAFDPGAGKGPGKGADGTPPATVRDVASPRTRGIADATPGTSAKSPRGLSFRSKGNSVTVATAARAGTVAEDGAGPVGAYADALAAAILQPGLELADMFRKVHDTVIMRTGGRQEPFVYNAPTEEPLVLNPRATKAAGRTITAQGAPPAQPEAKPAPAASTQPTRLATGPGGRLTLSTPVAEGNSPVVSDGDGRRIGVLSGHTGLVVAADFSRDGRLIATASRDRTARIWDAASLKQLAVLGGHAGDVVLVRFGPDAKRLATASSDSSVRIWDAATGAELLQLFGHTAEVREMAFSPDATMLVTVSADRTLRNWSLAKGTILWSQQSLEVPFDVLQFTAGGERLATAVSGRTLSLWDVAAGRRMWTAGGDTGTPRGRVDLLHLGEERVLIRLTTDSGSAATTRGLRSATAAKPRYLELDIATGAVVAEHTTENSDLPDAQQAAALVEAARRAAVPAPPTTKATTQATAQAPAQSPMPPFVQAAAPAQPPARAEPPPPSAEPPALSISDSARLLPWWSVALLVLAMAALWFSGPSLAGLILVAGLPLLVGFAARSAVTSASRPLVTHASPILHLALSGDGRYVATADALGRVWVRDAATGERVLARDRPDGEHRIHALRFSKKADYSDPVSTARTVLVVVGKSIESWSLQRGAWANVANNTPPPDTANREMIAAVVTADGAVWATFCKGSDCVLGGFGTPTTPSESFNFDGPRALPQRPTALAAVDDPSGMTPWLGFADGSVGNQLSLGVLAQGSTHSDAVSAIAPAGFATAWSLGGDAIDAWQGPYADPTLPCAGCESLATSADGARVIAGRRSSGAMLIVPGPPAGTSAARPRTMILPHPARVAAVAIDGNLAVTGGADGLAKLWHVGSGRELGFVRGHRGEITHALIAGDRVVTAAMDGSVIVTDVHGVRALSNADPTGMATTAADAASRQAVAAIDWSGRNAAPVVAQLRTLVSGGIAGEGFRDKGETYPGVGSE